MDTAPAAPSSAIACSPPAVVLSRSSAAIASTQGASPDPSKPKDNAHSKPKESIHAKPCVSDTFPQKSVAQGNRSAFFMRALHPQARPRYCDHVYSRSNESKYLHIRASLLNDKNYYSKIATKQNERLRALFDVASSTCNNEFILTACVWINTKTLLHNLLP